MAIDQFSGMPRRRKSLRWLLILIILLILAILVYLFLFYFKPKPATNNVNINQNVNQTTSPNTPAASTFNTANPGVLSDLQAANGGQPTFQNEQNNAMLIASSFTERFGSFSNQGSFRNFQELDQFLTDAVKKWVTTYLDGLKKEHGNINVYYAIETKAITTKINSFDDKAGLAEIVVRTQRQEFNNTITNPRIFYQDLLLKMIKVDNQWKVNGAYWQ